MRCSAISKGTRARKTLVLDLFGHKDIAVDLRPLTGDEEVDALATAHALAKAKGIDDPKEGQPIFDRMVMAAVLAVGCVDAESPADNPRPFFTGAEEVLTLDRDAMVMLYEAHEAWQEQCSPRKRDLTFDEYGAAVVKLASLGEGDSLDPFVRWPRALLVSFMRISARQLLSSLDPRSFSTSTPAATSIATKSNSESKSESAKTTKTNDRARSRRKVRR